MSQRPHELLLSNYDSDSSSESLAEREQESFVQDLMNLTPDGLLFEHGTQPFSPKSHLIHNWSGDSLLSSNALAIKKSLNSLWSTALEQFSGLEKQNPRTKQGIVSELLPYLSNEEVEELINLGINSIWHILKDKDHPLYNKVYEFRNIFTFRSVVVYFFKLRFVVHLAKQLEVKLEAQDIFNPASFIQHYFRAGSPAFFTSLCLGNHPYSWFTPQVNHKSELLKTTPLFLNISLTELTKVITFSQTQYLNFHEKNFSHALSHKEFGHFLNILMIHFPAWIKGNRPNKQAKQNGSLPKALRTRFAGDYLKSMALAYSLDQENQISNYWSEVITADICEASFASANFFRICHEFQGLTLLTKVARKQKYDVIPLISTVMKGKYLRSFGQRQGVLFNDPEDFNLLYERTIFNLSTLPEKNSYYYMLKEIQNEMKLLSEQGYLYVFTNQKLFVPSQIDRLKPFLKKIKLEMTVDFSKLKARGEITKYLYVFSKRPANFSETLSGQKHLKENCPTFSFQGELLHFAQFEVVAKSLLQFMSAKDINQTPILRQFLPHNIEFQYFQDAIIDGKILSAGSQDTVSITHPKFFNKITTNCVYLKTTFQVELIQQQEHTRPTNFLGFHLEEDRSYPYVLVVDYKNPSVINLQIINSESLEAFQDKFGTVTYFYLKLLPLNHEISIEALRRFLSNDIGQQIIQMTVSEKSLTPNKITKCIESLLIPNFLNQPVNNMKLPKSLQSLFDLNQEEILTYSPDELKQLYSRSEPLIVKYIEQYPSLLIGKISSLKLVVSRAKSKVIDDNINQTSIFFNPLIINEISKPESLQPLLPHNEDVYINPIEGSTYAKQIIGRSELSNQSTSSLTLFDAQSDLPLVEIHSEIKLLLFIQFILQHNPNLPLNNFLNHIQVPSLDKLNQAFQKFQQLGQQLNKMDLELDRIIKHSFLAQLTKE